MMKFSICIACSVFILQPLKHETYYFSLLLIQYELVCSYEAPGTNSL